ncbi:hypothetical protein BD779DRAFT_344710 [Infundibulicybe gibba]|nr:hypothetical protein BD779DRAFT_344710 [Infundibulicybe gibba]
MKYLAILSALFAFQAMEAMAQATLPTCSLGLQLQGGLGIGTGALDLNSNPKSCPSGNICCPATINTPVTGRSNGILSGSGSITGTVGVCVLPNCCPSSNTTPSA